RKVLRNVLGAGNRSYHLPDPGPPGLPEERIAVGKRHLTRIELPVQQPDPPGKLLRSAMGHAVPGNLRGCYRRQDLARCRLVQPADGADRAVSVVPDRCGPAVCLAKDIDRKSET